MDFLDLRKMIAKDRVNEIIPKCSIFKIGKTGEALLDRLHQPDYNDIYTHIKSVYTSTDAEKVSDVETYLIDKYIASPKCTNKKDGDASNNDTMADDAVMYQVYVVWK